MPFRGETGAEGKNPQLEPVAKETKRPSLTRRRFLVAGAGLTAAAGVAAYAYRDQLVFGVATLKEGVLGARDPIPLSDVQKGIPAVNLYQEMLETFTRNNEFRDSSGTFSGPASFWDMSRVIDATHTISLIPGCINFTDYYTNQLNSTKKYWNNGPDSKKYVPGYDTYPTGHQVGSPERLDDDALWMSIIMMRAFNETKHSSYLNKAAEIWNQVDSQWDQKDGGGINWAQQLPGEGNTSRNVVSNAPAVILGVELYKQTGYALYLQRAEEIYQWVTTTLLDPGSNLYNDRIDGTTINTQKWSYTQGLMVAAGSALHDVKPDEYPLSQSIDLGYRLLDYFDRAGYSGDDFSAITFSFLLQLSAKLQDEGANKAQAKRFSERVQTSLHKQVHKLERPKLPDNLRHAAGRVQLFALADVPSEQYKLL